MEDYVFFLHIRLGQFNPLEVLLRLLVTHANMAAQRQESPIRTQRQGLTQRPLDVAFLQHLTMDQTTVTDSLQRLAGHLQVVISLWLREALEVHQTRMQLLVVVSKLWRDNEVQPRPLLFCQGISNESNVY